MFLLGEEQPAFDQKADGLRDNRKYRADHRDRRSAKQSGRNEPEGKRERECFPSSHSSLRCAASVPAVFMEEFQATFDMYKNSVSVG
jgi:hypothetical protein